MSSRDRFRQALAHRQPDAIPVDFGATPVTGLHCSCVAALREHFGLEKRPVTVHEPYQMLGWLDEDLKAAMHLDVEGLMPEGTLFGFRNENWKTWRTPWGQEVLVAGGFQTSATPEGDLLIYPGGDRSAAPSGHMPKSGYFFDAIMRQEPLDDKNLRPEDNLEEFGPMKPEDLARLKAAVQERAGSTRGFIAGVPGTSLGDIAMVPAPFLKKPRGVRDVAEWYMTVVTHPDFVQAVFEKQTAIALANMEAIHGAVGEAFDAVFVCGTDFGTQASQFCSVETFRAVWKPYYSRINGWIHSQTQWKTFKHTCGAVEPLIPELIEAGFDILNPVQCSATGMDPGYLKAKYGRHITFWGGGIDTQHLLPFGTPADIRAQVLERCRIFGQDGGFVFNAIHNIQAQTPVANIVAMLNAVHEFNGTRR